MQDHPDYCDGFWDAAEFTPLYETECSPEYAAGWIAFWNVKAESEIDLVAHEAMALPAG